MSAKGRTEQTPKSYRPAGEEARGKFSLVDQIRPIPCKSESDEVGESVCSLRDVAGELVVCL